MNKSVSQSAFKAITTIVCALFFFLGIMVFNSISANAAVERNYTVDLSNGRTIAFDMEDNVFRNSKGFGEAYLVAAIMCSYGNGGKKYLFENSNDISFVSSQNPYQGIRAIREANKVRIAALSGSQGVGKYVISPDIMNKAGAFSEIDAANEILVYIIALMDGERDYEKIQSLLTSDIVINLEIKYSDDPVIINNTNLGVKSISCIPGREFEDNGIKYQILDAAGNLSAVELTSKVKNVNIPDSVSYLGLNLNVTDIAQNFMKGDRNAKKVTIGSNVTSIGKNAFYKSKKLKKVIVKSTKLTSIGKKAFGKNAKGFIVKLPKSCKKAYKKLLKKAKIKL